MKLFKALSLLTDIRIAISIAILPTLRDVFLSPLNPKLFRVFLWHTRAFGWYVGKVQI